MAPKRGAKAAPTEADVDGMSVADLKSKLQELGYSATGGKSVLADRLREVLKAEAAGPKKGAGKAKASEEAVPKRGAAKAKAGEAAPPKRGGAKADAAPEAPPPERRAPKAEEPQAEEEPAPKRGAPTAALEPAQQPVPKRAKAEAQTAPSRAAPAKAQGEKRSADGAAKASSSTVAAPAAAPAPDAAPASQLYFEDGDFQAEYAKSSRSECKKCKNKIMQGEMRIGKKMPSDKFDGMYTVWQHWTCFCATGLLPRTTQMIQGFSTLRPDDQEMISKIVPASASSGDPELDEAIKAQNKKVYEVVDVLSQLSENQLKEMLELNEYPSKKLGTTATITDLCADGIKFGATEKCEICEGCILLHGEGYRCRGWVSEFLKCTFKTQTPARKEWQLTGSAQKVSKLANMTMTTGDRLFAAEMRDDDEAAASQGTSQKTPPFLGLTFVVLDKGDAKSKEDIEKAIKDNAGEVTNTVTRAAYCIVSHSGIVEEDEENDHEVVAEAKQLGVPGAKEDFITSSVEAGVVQDMTPHLLWGEAKKAKDIKDTKTKFIEKMGVNMDADVGELAEKAHVMVDKASKCVYSEMLTKTDLVSGANSFYTMHLLESDGPGAKEYWVFKKWGRIGVSQGGSKVEECGTSKQKAVNEFSKKYLDQTGNAFGLAPGEFVVKTGKMVRIEIEHKALSRKGAEAKDEGDGTAGSAEGGDQPLGKLTKAQIEKGEAVLERVDKILSNVGEGVVEFAKAAPDFMSLTAEFYTMIPHNFGTKKPPVINNAELLGAEKALLAFYLRMGFEEMGGEEEAKLTPISGVMELELPATLKDCSEKVCSAKDIKDCVTKGTTMHKKKAGQPTKPMTPDLYGSILLYTSNAIYKQLNKALRDEDRTIVEGYFSYLRFLFEACARLPQQKKTLWRGVGVDLYPTYKVGSTIIWWGVSSCTSDESVARNFMAGCGDGATLLTVETETACDIAEVSFFANEAESILLPGTQLEVVSSKKTGKKSEIRLREVGRVVS